MLSFNLKIALPRELQINFEVAGVFFTPRPIKFHVDRWRSVVERPGLLDRLIVVELKAIELDAVAREVQIRLAQRSKIPPRHGK